MKKKFDLLIIFLLFIIEAVLVPGVLSETEGNDNITTVSDALHGSDQRPSFWTKTANNLNTSTILRMYKPYGNFTKLQKRILSGQFNYQHTTENLQTHLPSMFIGKNHVNGEEITTGEANHNITPLLPAEENDIEEEIMNDESFIGLKEFAGQLINDTAKLFSTKNGQSRSYPVEEPPQHQLWDDKDQTYHASSFTNAEYEPTAFHHHYIPPPSLHYYPPPKKEGALLTKVAIIALLKLILAKLKAIGFLKLLFLFMMKVPIMFFKFLFILKSFKLLKLVSIPLIMASFAAPFLPLVPFLAPLLFAPLLFAPLFLPLILPLLFFLPIVPIPSMPRIAAATTTRRRREAAFNAPIQEEPKRNETRARHLRNRVRPASYGGRRNSFEYTGKPNQYESTQESPNVVELLKRIVDSQNCIERVACELASQNESKIYHSAVMWALEKVHSLASQNVRRKIERYNEAYKMGSKYHSSDYCRSKFYCQRPKVLLIQGKSKYNVF